jgi:small nuclear ribonucleoprotein (snRNP)-like protein
MLQGDDLLIFCLDADVAEAFSALYHRGRRRLTTYVVWLNESDAVIGALRPFQEFENLQADHVSVIDLRMVKEETTTTRAASIIAHMKNNKKWKSTMQTIGKCFRTEVTIASN